MCSLVLTSDAIPPLRVQSLLAMHRPDLARKELKTLQEKDEDSTLTQLAQVGIRGRCNQGCRSGSGFGLDPDSIGSVDPDPDPGGQK
jgi:hypothetical protein